MWLLQLVGLWNNLESDWYFIIDWVRHLINGHSLNCEQNFIHLKGRTRQKGLNHSESVSYNIYSDQYSTKDKRKNKHTNGEWNKFKWVILHFVSNFSSSKLIKSGV